MKILLLEPHYVSAKAIARRLSSSFDDVSVMYAVDAASAVALAAKHRPDIVIAELQLGEKSGFEFLHEFKSYTDWQEIPVLVQTFADEELVTVKNLHWKHYKNTHFLSKTNLSLDKLESIVRHLTISYEAIS